MNDSIDDCDEVSRNADQTPLLVLPVVLSHKKQRGRTEGLADSLPPRFAYLAARSEVLSRFGSWRLNISENQLSLPAVAICALSPEANFFDANPSRVFPGLPGEAALENPQQCCPWAAEVLIDLALDLVSVVVALCVPTVRFDIVRGAKRRIEKNRDTSKGPVRMSVCPRTVADRHKFRRFVSVVHIIAVDDMDVRGKLDEGVRHLELPDTCR